MVLAATALISIIASDVLFLIGTLLFLEFAKTKVNTVLNRELVNNGNKICHCVI